MLADSKLPTTFWAEVVNTTCYVQNRVLVVKPHFKTPYELFKGRTHALSFMRPFRCHVIILNTLDQLGKFDGKSYEGIFVGYSTISKAFRVYNTRTRKVEENLHITFLKNKPLIAGIHSNDFADSSLLDSSSQDSDGYSKDKHGPSQASESDNQERPNAESSTKTDTGIFDDAYDDKDEGAKADCNNLETLSRSYAGRAFLVQATESFDTGRFTSWKRAIGTKWVYRNKRAQREIVVRNKVRLVAHGHKKEDGIDYDEVFALVARIEVIRGGLISQALGFMDLEFPDRVHKVEKALYGLHHAPRACVKLASTPMETRKPLSKDAAGTYVDVHLYRSMIGSFMYLTSSMPEIIFDVCACSRFQVQPKVSHMHAVKRIFRYLKGQPTLGLWYPKGSPLKLIAYSDSDYLGASLDRKSIIGEYIAASNCYGQTKHIEIRDHFIRDSYEKRLIEMVKIHTDYNVKDLLTRAFEHGLRGGLELKGYLINDCFTDFMQHADKKELAILEKTTGKEFSNPLMAGSLLKTISAKVSAASTNLVLLA
uniref:Uncharacterized protein n=1 Tax=Tanacetum cinerariifolium TaxID=118510 RepID=A0A6L2L8J3_TANCI|nr:hypothetical protein [Tanacetum cinerariifolium]